MIYVYIYIIYISIDYIATVSLDNLATEVFRRTSSAQPTRSNSLWTNKGTLTASRCFPYISLEPNLEPWYQHLVNLTTGSFCEAFAEVRTNPHVSAKHSPAVVLFASRCVVSSDSYYNYWVQEVFWSISGIGIK